MGSEAILFAAVLGASAVVTLGAAASKMPYAHQVVSNVHKAGLLGLSGLWWLAKRAVPRKFTRARRLRKYPGLLRPLSNIDTTAKWSG